VRLVLLGAPGSGKGTQGAVLAAHFRIPHVSSGELLRRHVAERTELGRSVTAYLARGELVPDDVVLEVVGDAVSVAVRTGGYLLDGFPRTLSQAERAFAWATTAGVLADHVIFLAVPDDVARQRLAGRVETGRVDDADPAAIERRLELFHDQTRPLLDFYDDRGILVSVDATQAVDAVSDNILAVLAG
jgi:adenylate kinase